MNTTDTRAVVPRLLPDQPVPAHLLRKCEQRTVGEAAAKEAKVTHPRNHSVRCDDAMRREQVCGRTDQRMVRK